MSADLATAMAEFQRCIVARNQGAAAVLHRARMQATVNGAARSGMFVISDFWRLRDGHWRGWRRHSTPLSAGPMPAERE